MKQAIINRRLKPSGTGTAFLLALLSLVFVAFPANSVLAQPAGHPDGKPEGKPLKLVLARQSTADPVEVMKHLSQKCPNITLTTNPKASNYMLYAGGWSGDYRFMVIAKGGDTIYATETALLSNAVKDVCKFLDTRQ
jgi:hypothetical protein